jgi:hypothetical protein
MSGLKVLAATFLSAALPFASTVAVMAADDPPPPPPKSALPAGTTTGSASKPMIIQNPDGTFTIQKEPPEDAKIFNGLVIPPQVVVPELPRPGVTRASRFDPSRHSRCTRDRHFHRERHDLRVALVPRLRRKIMGFRSEKQIDDAALQQGAFEILVEAGPCESVSIIEVITSRERAI